MGSGVRVRVRGKHIRPSRLVPALIDWKIKVRVRVRVGARVGVRVRPLIPGVPPDPFKVRHRPPPASTLIRF